MWGQFLASHGWRFGVLGGLLACSGFFSGSETAFFSLSRGQLHRMRRGWAGGRLAAGLMDSPQRLLNALLFGNLLVNVAYAGISALITLELTRSDVPPWAPVAASVGPLLVLILVGEVTPKMLAITGAYRWSSIAAGPLAVFTRAAAPVLWVLERALVAPLTRLIAPSPGPTADITAKELGGLMALSAKRGVIDHDANALLQEIVELTDLRVCDIMVPRVDMISYDVGGPREGLVELFRRTRLRKVPVYSGHVDNIIGVVHAKRLLLREGAALSQLVVKVPFVPEAASVERVLMQFRVTQTQMAVVVDEYGGTAGLVTLEDVLEEIVGDIPDPHDLQRGPAVQQMDKGQYLIDGDLAIHEWVDAFKIDLSGKRISTVGGFVTSLIGRIPSVGDTAGCRNLRFTVVSMRRRRVGLLRLELAEDTP